MRRITFKLVSAGAPAVPQYDFSQTEIVLGRDPSVDIIIDSPGVSRRHARVVDQDGAFVLEDLGSSNGTFLNEQPVTAPTVLQAGDEIGLGQHVRLVFDIPPVRQTAAEPTAIGLTAAPGMQQTMGEEIVLDDSPLTRPMKAVAVPQLSVAVAGSEPVVYSLTKDVITIGRAEDNDIVVLSKIASRYHAKLERADGGYRFVPSLEAGNPVLFEGRPLQEEHPLRHDDLLRIGSTDPGSMVTLQYISPTEMAAAPAAARNINFGQKTVLSIGRDASNDIVLDNPKVSRYHAQLERVGQRYRISDLRSSNGTFVNDERLEGQIWLAPDDAIRIGPYRFVVGTDELAQFDESGGLHVECIGLNKWVRKGLNILQNISLVFQPREFIVVVGQSGGGKSTLVDAIAGYRPATHGKVLVNEIDAYKNFDAIRHNIGFVPQRDIIHMELTVFQALDYAARLRMPSDTTRQERQQRIIEVLEDLDLVHRKDVPISGLSGGQQKRVSIGVELLTKPELFFLDEPTSGLDPGTETALMHLMRRLADQGRTIVLITHATKNVMLADKVIFLARGGYLAWFGPPDEALKYFDQFRSERDRRARDIEFDEIYAILDNSGNGTPAEWAERFQQTDAYLKNIVQPLSDHQQSMAEPRAQADVTPAKPQRQRRVGSLRQFLILSGRNLKILTRDKFSLILMLAAAPLVALLDVVLALALGNQPFDHLNGNPRAVMITLFLMPVYGVMVGALATMREIVKEQDIYRRERLVNLKILPYVMSKVWFAALLALYHAAAYTAVRYFAFQMPGGTLELALIYVTMVLATFAGMMLGLFTSALAPNANSAPLIVILMVLPQIVLGGAMIPLPNAVTMPTITRWGFEALMAITGPGSDVAADACWALPADQRSAMTIEDKATFNCACMGAAMFDANSCNFPSIGKYADAALNEPPPVEPAALGPEPQEPELPPRPTEPQDQSDTVAMADYFEDLQEWEAQVTQIQDNYRTEVSAYRAQADVYQAAMIEYNTERAQWLAAREGSAKRAEGVIAAWKTDYGWTFANKEEPAAFMLKVLKTWGALGAMSFILLVLILILQKRKDIV